MARFLVTGALGCLGAWTIHELADQGHEVVALDLGTDDARLRAVFAPDDPAGLPGLTRITADVTDLDGLERLVRDHGIERIVHLAALQIPFARANPPLGARVNVLGTVAVFEVAAKCSDQVSRVVYASSAAVYGPPSDYPPGPIPEDAAVRPRTHYGVYKLANEGTGRVYFEERGVSSVGLRPYIVYGVGRDQGLTSFPTRAMVAAITGREYRVPFSGVYAYQLARDVARMLIAAALADHRGAPVYNCPGTADTAAIVETIESAVPKARGRIELAPDRLPFPSEIEAVGLASLLPDFRQTPIADGVRESIDQFRRALEAGVLDPARYLDS
jgi:nucleoside-diphosphate-sugar epimerase